MKRIVLTILLSFIQLACQKSATMDFSAWHNTGGGAKPPPVPHFEEKNSTAITSRGNKIKISQQTLFGVKVVDGFLKQIKSNDDDLSFQAYNIVTSTDFKLRSDVIVMKNSRPSYLKKVLVDHPELARLKEHSHELIIKNMKPFWRTLFEDRSGLLQSVDISRDYKSSPVTPVGSQLGEAQALIFPQGPLKSSLQDVILNELLDPSLLISDYIKISTHSPLTAEAVDKKFSFSPEDSRFFQVQAYYYSTKVIDWFKNKYNLNLPFQLNIETSLGYPDKTNTAFYFARSIRLGDGDDLVFSKIPLDPSIVMHESSHAIIDYVAQLPFQDEGGSINEGLADFFTTSILQNPLLGEVAYKKAPFKRTVQNTLKLSDKNGGLYHDSGIVSGLLWQIRTDVEEQTSLDLAWNLLSRCHPKTDFKSLRETLQVLVNNMPADKQLKLISILKDRGWLE